MKLDPEFYKIGRELILHVKDSNKVELLIYKMEVNLIP